MVITLKIPEILSHVGLYLTENEIVDCILVCKSWNLIFTPLLYRYITISSSDKRITAETFRKHANSIHRLRYRGQVDTSFFSLECSSLKYLLINGNKKHLTSRIPELFAATAALIRRSKTLRQFIIQEWPESDSGGIWRAISESPSVNHISIYKCTFRPQDADPMWEAFSKMRILMLYEMIQQVDQETGASSLIPGSLPCLVDLQIKSLQGISNSDQLLFIRRAPNLCSLRWEPDHSHTNPIATCHEMMSFQMHPKLRILAIKGIHMSDRQIGLTLDTMTDALILVLGKSGFSRMAYQVLLTKHSRTIRILCLCRDIPVTSAMTQTIMTECPNLEYLKLNTIQGSELVQVEWNDQVDSAGRVESIENVVVAKDWTCLKLISLSIRIELTNEIVKSGLNDQLFHARCERRRQLESEHAFRQLSRLTRLEKLDISSCEAVSIQSLMLKLDQSGKGLQQLVSLKNLRKLAFEDTFQEMSEEDLDWMFENWPLLASLVGKLHILHGIDIELRKYINEEIRERIAKANAGTSLHTLVARMMVNLS